MFQTAIETRNTSMDAKLDALMKKFRISLQILDPEKLEDSSSSETEQPLSAMPKMDLPGFDSSDALSWLSRAEQYFLVHHIPVAQCVQIALIALSGSAMSWIQILLRRCPNLTWSQFSKQLLHILVMGPLLTAMRLSSPRSKLVLWRIIFSPSNGMCLSCQNSRMNSMWVLSSGIEDGDSGVDSGCYSYRLYCCNSHGQKGCSGSRAPAEPFLFSTRFVFPALNTIPCSAADLFFGALATPQATTTASS